MYSKALPSVEPNTTIESATFNAVIDDFVSDANTARPISAGGTGGTSASTARAGLSVALKQTAVDDTTAGSGLIVGAFGVGGVGISVPDDDLNSAGGVTAVYKVVSTYANLPVAASGTCLNLARGDDRDAQVFFRTPSNEQYVRQRTGSTTWTDWAQVVTVVGGNASTTNGYIQYSDGTMEAWLKTTQFLAISTAFQGGYRSALQVWTFQVPFTAEPEVVGNPTGLTAVALPLGNCDATVARYAWWSAGTVSSGTLTASLRAYGRWF